MQCSGNDKMHKSIPCCSCLQATGRTIVLNVTNDPEKDKDMVQAMLGTYTLTC